MATSTLACTYAALLLFDSNKTITASDILAVTKAANVTVPKFHAEVFASSVDKDSLTNLVNSLSTPGGSVSSGSSEAPKKEEKKEVKKEEKKAPVKEKTPSDEGVGMGGMFGDDD